MTAMALAAVMDALADRVREDTALERVYEWPLSTVTPPAFVVDYPEPMQMDAAYARNDDRASFICWLFCGAADTLSARDILSAYLEPVKAAIDGSESGVWQSARVSEISIGKTPMPDETEHLTARYTVDILT